MWWAEQGLVVHSEFRDGNVPAGFEQLRLLKEAEAMLPEGVKSVRMRCGSAGYQEALLRYCEMGGSERFGRIEFAVASDVTQEFKKAVAEVAEDDGHTIYRVDRQGQRHATAQQWAKVYFVPNTLARSTKGQYRFLAVREALAHQPLPALPSLPGHGVWEDVRQALRHRDQPHVGWRGGGEVAAGALWDERAGPQHRKV